MGYRKIIVNEQTYEYVVGKTNTKIKGIGVFENDKIGNVESVNNDMVISVTPSIIQNIN